MMIHAPAHDDIASTSSRRLRCRDLVVAALALAFLLTALAPVSSAEATKVPKNFVAITQATPLTDPDLQQMHDLKVKSVRLGITWSAVEPQKGVYHWPDARIAALARNGISPAPFVWATPNWVSHSPLPGVAPIKGKAKRGWQKFLKKLVKRYKPGGKFWREHPDLPKKPIKTWQIWNEPNLPKYFAKPGTPKIKQVKHAPKAYAKFVKKSDKAIHKSDKHAKVVLAGLSGNPKKKKMQPQKFLKKFFKTRKITKHFDAAALHPYAPKISKFKQRVSKMSKALKKGGARKKELWLTEVGWGSARHDKFSLTKGPAGQAKMLKKSFKTSLKKRKKWNIDRLFWFDWRDPAFGPRGCSFCPSAGLLKNDGTHKPAYKKFKHFSKRQGKGGHHGHHHSR
jgi:polysaccharide biosynthesis protein PslG